MTSPPPLDNVDLSDIEFWRLSQNDRAEVFRQYRTTDPFPFFDEPENPIGPDGPGYYVLTRHRDVVDPASPHRRRAGNPGTASPSTGPAARC